MSEKEALKLFFEARSLDKKRRFEEAIQKYEEAVALDDKLGKAWFYKWRLHYQLGQFSEATHCAQKATEIDMKWRKFITEFQRRREHIDKIAAKRKSQGEQPKAKKVPKPRPDMKIQPTKWKEWKKRGSLPKDFAEHTASLGFTEEFLLGIVDQLNTEIVQDGRVLHVQRSVIAYIGMATEAIDGKGPQEVKYQLTGEEWILERTGPRIIIHWYNAPKQIHDPRLSHTYFAWVDHPYRLILALNEAGKIDLRKIGDKMLMDHQGRVYWFDEEMVP